VYNSDFEFTSVLRSCYVPLVLAQYMRVNGSTNCFTISTYMSRHSYQRSYIHLVVQWLCLENAAIVPSCHPSSSNTSPSSELSPDHQTKRQRLAEKLRRAVIGTEVQDEQFDSTTSDRTNHKTNVCKQGGTSSVENCVKPSAIFIASPTKDFARHSLVLPDTNLRKVETGHIFSSFIGNAFIEISGLVYRIGIYTAVCPSGRSKPCCQL
jgi:hypothetical protein